jgi:hypothetical protein
MNKIFMFRFLPLTLMCETASRLNENLPSGIEDNLLILGLNLWRYFPHKKNELFYLFTIPLIVHIEQLPNIKHDK